jgi:hypothetical protein
MRRNGHQRISRIPRIILHFGWLIALLIVQSDFCSSLAPATNIHQSQRGNARCSGFCTSSLFQSESRLLQRQKTRQHRSQRSSSTALPMVLTTPEAIIEQASTVTLLDDLIDESVRTSARKPIMMQFDPSSGWVSICEYAC